MPDLTLIIPAKHEVESLPVFLEEIKNYKYLFQLIKSFLKGAAIINLSHFS